MYNNFGKDIVKIFRNAEEERYKLKHPYVGTEHLLLSLLKYDNDIKDLFISYDLTYDKFKKELVNIVGSATNYQDINLYTPLLKRIINNSLEKANDNKSLVTTKHLLISLLEEGEGIAIRILIGMDIDLDDLYDNLIKDDSFNNKKLKIYEIGNNLNETVSMNEKVIGRDKEIDMIIETLLRKKKNNPILLGDAGVGKSAIVEELARRINNHDVPLSLEGKKIISLEMGELVSGTKYRGEFEEKLTKIIKEVSLNPDIILFIDEIHSMVNAGGAEGAITAGDILKPYLARGNIKCIGATTKEEYIKYFSSDKALMRRFEVINVLEPNKNETKKVLLTIKDEYELHHNVRIPKSIIELIIDITDKYIFNKKNPDKAIDFLDSVCSRVKTKSDNQKLIKKNYDNLELLKRKKKEAIKENNYEKALLIYKEELKIKEIINNNNEDKKIIIRMKDVLDTLERKTNIPMNKESLKILDIIKKKSNIKYSNYIDIINNSIKNNNQNHLGLLTFLLEGSTQISKSSLVDYYGDYLTNNNYIKINLKDNLNSINNIIYNKVKNNLYTVVLLDNYDCASKIIKNEIIDILKNKYILINEEKILLNNAIIFITKNISSDSLGFNNTSNNIDEINNYVDVIINFNKELVSN